MNCSTSTVFESRSAASAAACTASARSNSTATPLPPSRSIGFTTTGKPIRAAAATAASGVAAASCRGTGTPARRSTMAASNLLRASDEAMQADWSVYELSSHRASAPWPN